MEIDESRCYAIGAWGAERGGRGGSWRVERKAMGLGFGVGEKTVAARGWRWRQRRDSLRFYVAITVSQMPLSKIDGMVNLISTRRAKERHLIFGDCSAWCEIKFSDGQTAPSAQ